MSELEIVTRKANRVKQVMKAQKYVMASIMGEKIDVINLKHNNCYNFKHIPLPKNKIWDRKSVPNFLINNRKTWSYRGSLPKPFIYSLIYAFTYLCIYLFMLSEIYTCEINARH